MARSTPTYTPVRNYAIGFFLSVALLLSDIRYEAFAPLRGFINASTLYAQMISDGIFENTSTTFSSFQRNRNILQENKELKDEILEINTESWLLITYQAIIVSLFAHLLMFYLYKFYTVGKIFPFYSLFPIFGITLSYMIFNEVPSLLFVFGGIIVISSVILLHKIS